MAKSSLDHCRVFAPEFFDAMARREGRWRTELAASSNGPYRVLQRDKVFAVMNDPEPDDGTPEAEFTEEQSALLMAATLGANHRPSTWGLAENRDEAGKFPVLERKAQDAKVVGRMRYRRPRDLSQMHVAEYILRSPHRLAHFLEAAGGNVLSGAAKILTRRFGFRDPETSPTDEAETGRIACRYRLKVVAEQTLEHEVARALKSGDEQARWLAEAIPRSPLEIGGGLYLDTQYRPIGYTQYDGGFARMTLEPRQIFAPALLLNAGYVCVWHTHPEEKEPTPSDADHHMAIQLHSCGGTLCIPMLTSIVLGAEGSYAFVER